MSAASRCFGTLEAANGRRLAASGYFKRRYCTGRRGVCAAVSSRRAAPSGGPAPRGAARPFPTYQLQVLVVHSAASYSLRGPCQAARRSTMNLCQFVFAAAGDVSRRERRRAQFRRGTVECTRPSSGPAGPHGLDVPPLDVTPRGRQPHRRLSRAVTSGRVRRQPTRPGGLSVRTRRAISPTISSMMNVLRSSTRPAVPPYSFVESRSLHGSFTCIWAKSSSTGLASHIGGRRG